MTALDIGEWAEISDHPWLLCDIVTHQTEVAPIRPTVQGSFMFFYFMF